MNKVLAQVETVGKAIAAAVLPLVSVSLLNGSFDYKAIIAAAVTALAVYFVPNPAPAKPATKPGK